MKLFQQDSLNNASYLDRYYQELNTSSYNPIVREPVNHGSFKKNVYWMLEYEGTNTCIFVDESFNGQNDASIKSLTAYISSSIERPIASPTSPDSQQVPHPGIRHLRVEQP